MEQDEISTHGTHARFHETRWTNVLKAAESSSPDAEASMENLCRAYWYPLYAFVRRSGRTPAEAADLTQGFFARLIEKRPLKSVDRSRGRFRTFLLACLRNFLNNHRDYERAAIRDKEKVVWWDGLAPEERYQLEPADQPAETLFDKGWAVSLVNGVMDELRSGFTARGKGALFGALQKHLTGEVPDGALDAVAAELHMNGNTLKSELHRLRRDFGQRLRAAVRETLDDPSDQELKEEIRHLLANLAS